MSSISKIALLAVLASPFAMTAQAAPCGTCEIFPVISNTQIASHQRVDTQVNVNVKNIEGATDLSATAVGNNLSVSLEESVGNIDNHQSFGGIVTSNLNLKTETALGDITLNNTAAANNASLTFATAEHIGNKQIAYNDPAANTTLNATTALGNVEVSTTALGNGLSVNGRFQSLTSSQSTSWAPVLSNTAVNIGSVAGDLTIAGTAVGNNVSIKGF
jgi:hypothetical protein